MSDITILISSMFERVSLHFRHVFMLHVFISLYADEGKQYTLSLMLSSLKEKKLVKLTTNPFWGFLRIPL
jgi:hypothetical protein